MVKKFIQIVIMLVAIQLSLQAHSLILNSMDNGDGTMEVIGKFSTGAATEGAMVQLISLNSNQILFEKRMDSSGSLLVDIPKEPYKIVLDSGPGHKSEKMGSVSPQNGFTMEQSFIHINMAYFVTLFLSVGFLVATFILVASRRKKQLLI